MQKNAVRQDKKCVRSLLADCSEGIVEVFRFTYVVELQLYSHRLGGGTSLVHRRNMKWIKRIDEHGDMRKRKHNFTQKLEPFALEVWRD
jgi:hypothetical protein